ncbi:LEM domain-containing protein 1 isoform X4 [Ictalurus punctatus]|uniref:LEM domain-containing protein 1 isoform X4 n=1 Tax=Ictalurus punctatus TaxID=7998 RepID=A0A979F852_ICTPU|nr:LEM domain-containing protein 1 isoform X4 [Ictalurus punctatus]
MMTQCSQHSVNNKDDGKYSDSEEEEEEEEEEESGSEQPGPESVSHTDLGATRSAVGLNCRSKETFYPLCFVPPVRQDKNLEESLDSLQSSSLSFSITQLVEEIENRLNPQSKSAETKGSCSQTPVASRAQLEAMTDVLMEMFPDTVVTPTGITATKRRSIKGAAGRPVQFKYPETPLSPASLERREIRQHLVSLWVQVVVFFLVAALLYFIYVSMEEPLENPFSVLLNGPSHEPSSDDLALVPNSQDTQT